MDTQILGLAYRSGEAWNEAGFANAEFDTLLAEANSLADADARREVMAKLQDIMTDEGVTIQPYWRTVYRHAKPGIVGWDMHIAYLPQMYKVGLRSLTKKIGPPLSPGGPFLSIFGHRKTGATKRFKSGNDPDAAHQQGPLWDCLFCAALG